MQSMIHRQMMESLNIKIRFGVWFRFGSGLGMVWVWFGYGLGMV